MTRVLSNSASSSASAHGCDELPAYLSDQLKDHPNPRAAMTEWLRDARYGLFLHYGLYSLLGRHEWVQYHEQIPVAEYEKLQDQFVADGFDADRIAEIAVECGMRYINLTTRHHDSFCLWNTATTRFNSVRAKNCGRDLVGEMAEACQKHGLALCLYLSHGRDWRHPHAPNNDRFDGRPRPLYDPPEPTYAVGDDHDLDQYLNYLRDQVRELLTHYGPIAAIWLDGIFVPLMPRDEDGQVIEGYNPRRDGDPFKLQELYDLIHGLQPATLVSYKQGYLRTEDFYAPEHDGKSTDGKPLEICTTMTPGSWGFSHELVGKHIDADTLWGKLESAASADANLLINTGLSPDGSLVPGEVETLRQVGRRLARSGFPTGQ